MPLYVWLERKDLKSDGGDINIFGLAPGIKCPTVRDIAENAQSSCLFVMDSGQESALV